MKRKGLGRYLTLSKSLLKLESLDPIPSPSPKGEGRKGYEHENRKMFLKYLFLFIAFLSLSTCSTLPNKVREKRKEDKTTCKYLKATDTLDIIISEENNPINLEPNKHPLHFLIEYNDSNDIVGIREYDSNSVEIFSYAKQYVRDNLPGKYITIISGKLINRDREIIKSYYFHSNIGFTFTSYKIDSISNSLKEYEILEEGPLTSVNKNPFQQIKEIHSLNDILNNEIVIKIEKKTPTLKNEYFFDKRGNSIRIIHHQTRKESESISVMKYNSDDQLTYSNKNSLDSTSSELFYTYSNKSVFDDSKKGNRIQFVRTYYNWELMQKQPIDIYHYEYNDKNLMTCLIKYYDGRLQSKTNYSYYSNGRLKQEDFSDKTTGQEVTIQYTYNEYNHLEKYLKITSYDGTEKEKIVFTSRYKYIFY